MALPCAAAGSKRRCDDASRRDDVRSTAPAPLAPNTPLRPPREKRAAAAVCDTLEAPSAGPRRRRRRHAGDACAGRADDEPLYKRRAADDGRGE